MGATTGIQWTDATWNPVGGCSIKSPGCTNCYAQLLAGTRLAQHPLYAGTTTPSKAGPVFNGHLTRAADAADVWTWPRRWRGSKVPKMGAGKPSMIFVGDMADLFHEDRPEADIDRVFAVMALAPQHIFQVLTKRAERMREWFEAWPDGAARKHHIFTAAHKMLLGSRRDWSANDPEFLAARNALMKWPLPNVWLGVSVEDQKHADERIPLLLDTPAAKRFISAEPLLGPVDIQRWVAIDWQCSFCREFFSGRHRSHCPSCGKEGGWTGSHAFNGKGYPKRTGFPLDRGSGLDWVISGGESGRNARPMHPDWARALRDQCQAAGVSFHFKQWGEFAPGDDAPDAHTAMRRVGKKAAGRLLDGVEHNGFPA